MYQTYMSLYCFPVPNWQRLKRSLAESHELTWINAASQMVAREPGKAESVINRGSGTHVRNMPNPYKSSVSVSLTSLLSLMFSLNMGGS